MHAPGSAPHSASCDSKLALYSKRLCCMQCCASQEAFWRHQHHGRTDPVSALLACSTTDNEKVDVT